jgi:hypothetical protein
MCSLSSSFATKIWLRTVVCVPITTSKMRRVGVNCYPQDCTDVCCQLHLPAHGTDIRWTQNYRARSRVVAKTGHMLLPAIKPGHPAHSQPLYYPIYPGSLPNTESVIKSNTIRWEEHVVGQGENVGSIRSWCVTDRVGSRRLVVRRRPLWILARTTLILKEDLRDVPQAFRQMLG